jgi:hypothetical protein
MRVSMRLGFVASIAACFLWCSDLIAAAQTYSPNDPYWLRPNSAHGRFGNEDYYLPGSVQRAPRGMVGSRRPLAMPSEAIPLIPRRKGLTMRSISARSRAEP